AMYVDPTLQPTRIASANDNIALVGSSTGVASQDTVSTLESQARISAGTTPAPMVNGAPAPSASTFNYQPLGSSSTPVPSRVGAPTPVPGTAATAADLALKEQIRCSYVKTAFTAATSKGPDSVNPNKDTFLTSIFTSTDMQDNDVVKTAAVMKLVMNG